MIQNINNHDILYQFEILLNVIRNTYDYIYVIIIKMQFVNASRCKTLLDYILTSELTSPPKYEKPNLHQVAAFQKSLKLPQLSPSHAAIKISINATAAEFICKNIFPTPMQVKKI